MTEISRSAISRGRSVLGPCAAMQDAVADGDKQIIRLHVRKRQPLLFQSGDQFAFAIGTGLLLRMERPRRGGIGVRSGACKAAAWFAGSGTFLARLGGEYDAVWRIKSLWPGPRKKISSARSGSLVRKAP